MVCHVLFHPITLPADRVNPLLLGMTRVLSEDAVRRGLAKIDAVAGETWLQENLDYLTRPLFGHQDGYHGQPHQEGAVVGYNPGKPGRPSHGYHTYLIANLRLVLDRMLKSMTGTKPPRNTVRRGFGRCRTGWAGSIGRACCAATPAGATKPLYARRNSVIWPICSVFA